MLVIYKLNLLLEKIMRLIESRDIEMTRDNSISIPNHVISLMVESFK